MVFYIMSSTDSDSVYTSSDELDYQVDNLNLKGNILGEYNVISELGRGSYSIVWLGYKLSTRKFYAIKVQHPNDYKEGKEENQETTIALPDKQPPRPKETP